MKDNTVLLVEDDHDIQENLRYFLESEGYQVASAFNGHEALEYLRAQKPAKVILLDLMMPVMDGYEFLDKYFSDEFFSGLKDVALRPRPSIVILSASPDLELTARKRGLSFVKKPLDLDLLLTKLSSS